MKSHALITCLLIILWATPLTGHTHSPADPEGKRVTAGLAAVMKHSQSRTSTVEKKDGQIISGTIQGIVVQKGKINEALGEDGSKRFDTRYVLSNGDRITAIDKQGVHTSWIISLGAYQEGEPPNDLEVLKPGKTGFMNPRKGGKLTILALDYGPRVPIKEALLGTVRKKPGTEDEVILVPALEIMTANGLVTLPVSEVVAFQTDAKDARK
jgi:hypothetical protein